MEKNTYFELATLVEKQGEIIKQQAETIAELTNENAEKENLINSFLQECGTIS